MARSKAETGTLIFALGNLVIVVGSWITGLNLLIMFIQEESYRCEDRRSWIIKFILASFVSLLSLIFSLLLISGIRKKKPGHLNLCFIIGVVECFVAPVAFIWLTYQMSHVYVYISVACFYIIYPPILYMIRYTYLQYIYNNGDSVFTIFKEINFLRLGDKNLVVITERKGSEVEPMIINRINNMNWTEQDNNHLIEKY